MDCSSQQIPVPNEESLFLSLKYGAKTYKVFKYLHSQGRLEDGNYLLRRVLFIREKGEDLSVWEEPPISLSERSIEMFYVVKRGSSQVAVIGDQMTYLWIKGINNKTGSEFRGLHEPTSSHLILPVCVGFYEDLG